MIGAVVFDFNGSLAARETLRKAASVIYLAQHDRRLPPDLIDCLLSLRLSERVASVHAAVTCEVDLSAADLILPTLSVFQSWLVQQVEAL